MTGVLLIDDHPIVLQGCRRVLQDAGVQDVLEANGVAAGYRLFRRNKPDVVVVDLSMKTGGLGGLELIRRMRLHDKRMPILAFSMHSDPVIVSRALKAGATGYVLKDAGPRDFLDAFESVRRHKPYLGHEMAMQVAMLGSAGHDSPLAETTSRELQTLALLAEGKPYAQIASDLGVSYKTVVNISSQLKSKLGARNLPELIKLAVQYVSSPSEYSR
ncbi:response regulator transcription factor [Allomesorhizobium alhagi]|uniref:LuxR family transcriptional regulator n=1 Tax=Mesorhizobium alhagi CCNWXJ12-2 TaxID=1107882 RepID=H0I204_9HYPH|nr:response regulator transcription factor [Mesorhizobium alhagi]EHK52993.1 LuxR family transcriptional regulator [Mesorhizobium alhagi CCNWXJ12-2]